MGYPIDSLRLMAGGRECRRVITGIGGEPGQKEHRSTGAPEHQSPGTSIAQLVRQPEQ